MQAQFRSEKQKEYLPMVRFTPHPEEIRHLQEIEYQLSDIAPQNRWRLKVVLINGKELAGCLGGTSSGNNGEQGDRRAYCGKVIVVEDTGTIHILDKLDIARVQAP
jgi:hypothetical protein